MTAFSCVRMNRRDWPVRVGHSQIVPLYANAIRSSTENHRRNPSCEPTNSSIPLSKPNLFFDLPPCYIRLKSCPLIARWSQFI
jgi:hypothetical protein